MKIISAVDSIFQKSAATAMEREWNDMNYKNKNWDTSYATPHPLAQRKLDECGWVPVESSLSSGGSFLGGFVRRHRGGLQVLQMMGRRNIDDQGNAAGHEWKLTSMLDGGFGNKYFNDQATMNSMLDWIEKNPGKYDEVTRMWPNPDPEKTSEHWQHVHRLYQQAKAGLGQ